MVNRVANDGLFIDNVKIGREIKRKRIRLDVGQEVPAKASGCSKSTISRVEMGKGFLDLRNLATLSRWVGMPPESFFSNNSEAVVHYTNPDFRQFISAVLYADKSLNQKSREILIDFMIVAYENATE